MAGFEVTTEGLGTARVNSGLVLEAGDKNDFLGETKV
jgi:hypothetical protein